MAHALGDDQTHAFWLTSLHMFWICKHTQDEPTPCTPKMGFWYYYPAGIIVQTGFIMCSVWVGFSTEFFCFVSLQNPSLTCGSCSQRWSTTPFLWEGVMHKAQSDSRCHPNPHAHPESPSLPFSGRLLGDWELLEWVHQVPCTKYIGKIETNVKFVTISCCTKYSLNSLDFHMATYIVHFL